MPVQNRNFQHPDPKTLIIPLVMLLLLTAGSVLFYLAQTARLLDEREVEQTARLARSALNAELNHLGDWAYDYGYWDDSVAKLIDNLDPEWADNNIGSYLSESYEITASVVYGVGDEHLISFLDGKKLGPDSPLAQVSPQVRPLIAETRKAAADGPETATGLIVQSDTIYLAAAQAIMPENNREPRDRPHGVLVLLKAFTPDLMSRISREYLLPQLRIQRERQSSTPASQILTAANGDFLGFLEWSPQRPGRKIFHALAPAIPIPLLLGVGLVIFFQRRMRGFFDERLLLYNQLASGKENLAQSEETLGSIIEAIPSPLFFKDIEGIYLGCNQAFCDYLGLSKDAIIGHTEYDIAPEDLARTCHQADQTLLEQGSSQTYTTQVVYADGSRRDILFNKASIVGSNGRVIGLAGVMTDISDELGAEREMRRLKNLLRNIIDSMPSMLITVDEELRVTEWNRWAAVASRVPAEKAMGRPLFEVFPALKEQNIDLTEALNSGEVHTWPRIPWKLHLREIFVDLTVYPLDRGKGKGAVLRADNTTDRVHMEEVMVLSEKMHSIGSLAAGMAHEINNPLAIILQHTQIMGNRFNPDLKKNRDIAAECNIDLENLTRYLQQRGHFEMLEAIRKAGNRARRIVEEMVNFAQRQETQYASWGLPDLIEETLHLAESDYDLKKKFAFNSIEIVKQISPDLPKIDCDKHDIQQVLLNLLRNSAQAMHREKTPQPRIEFKIEPAPDAVIITLTDNGPGIAPNLLKRVFEPFFTTGKTGDGTGLGLSVAYFIVHEKHGGDIRVENLVSGGCRFIIRLPHNARPGQEAAA